MADDKHAEAAHAGGDEEEQSNYQKPKPKPLTEILNTDAEDESLRKYKESLGLTTANSKDLEVCKCVCVLNFSIMPIKVNICIINIIG